MTDAQIKKREIESALAKIRTGDYIYRGEPEHCEEKPYFGKVSSTLYRGGPEAFDSGRFNLMRTQEETVREARNYIHKYEKMDFEILTELQHFGKKTNLIDFTTDYHIALFFACDCSHDKGARVILLKKTEEINEKYQIENPESPQNRVMAQKSIFAQPPNGFIDSRDITIISVPANFKQWILIHLRKFQDISTQSIYNDLHGFIRHSNLRSSEKALFPIVFADMIVKDMADASLEERNDQFQKAIDYYTERIQYAPYDAANYVKQGQWYAEIAEIDRAIETFSKAIFLKPDYAIVYNNRGEAYRKKDDYDRAIEDFNEAIKLKPDYAYAYYKRGWAYGNKGENDSAIKDFTKLIELNRCNPEPYFYGCMVYHSKGEYDLAIEDYTKTIELKPDFVDAYHTRGLVWLPLGKWERAKTDLTITKEKGIDIIALYRNFYPSVENFEQKHGIQLPADIAAMLTPLQA